MGALLTLDVAAARLFPGVKLYLVAVAVTRSQVDLNGQLLAVPLVVDATADPALAVMVDRLVTLAPVQWFAGH